jgi:uncharacterized protein (DUF1501 family)
MTAVAGLFNAGQAAVLLNVGPLVKPLTRAQYNNSNRVLYPRPPQLFSHNDQQSVWQSSSPEGSSVGWGGNIGDLAIQNSLNTNSLFTCMSVTDNAVYLAGDTALQYRVSTSGAVKIKPATNASLYGSTALPGVLSALIEKTGSANRLENEYNAVTTRAKVAESTISTALALAPPATVFPTDSLGQQLKMVARLIKGRATLGAKRQVFFVSIGGFDLHDFLIDKHPGLLTRVSEGMKALYDATVEMGIASEVTSFTASDFGRTLASNGDGSDHGWGSHHLVVGGAVKGKAFYGTPPPLSISNTAAAADQWHVGQGRLLPSTSVDQYAATLAKWFGVSSAEMPSVLPNINNFGAAAVGSNADIALNGRGFPIDLGFMQ